MLLGDVKELLITRNDIDVGSTMEIDEPGNMAKSAVVLPSLRQLVTRELTAKQTSVAIPYNDTHLQLPSTSASTTAISDQDSKADSEVAGSTSCPSTHEQHTIGSSTPSPSMTGKAVLPSIDHRMDIILDPRSTIEKLTSDNGPVLSFPFFNPTKVCCFCFVHT